ncbi:hypothetical protein LCGC14_1254050 [marine sediment metagenome]|uniref:Uncharacterized protein n=1 Tax=marine sediment metagenome TaxID=412755 RepID=A0A0F9L5M0_9ZZZZ
MTHEEKLKDIKDNPERHRHSFQGLQACSMHNGALDTQLVDAHETYASVGMNGGRRCDVVTGPCACGAWH